MLHDFVLNVTRQFFFNWKEFREHVSSKSWSQKLERDSYRCTTSNCYSLPDSQKQCAQNSQRLKFKKSKKWGCFRKRKKLMLVPSIGINLQAICNSVSYRSNFSIILSKTQIVFYFFGFTWKRSFHTYNKFENVY